ncbi:MAG: hypothetical protein U9R32_07140, partial [Bacteroidota bacterium]|nr:hypothetical protein [Bacteroidota bacterium]
KNIMLNRNLNALVSGHINYKRMKRAIPKSLIHTTMIIMATSIRQIKNKKFNRVNNFLYKNI